MDLSRDYMRQVLASFMADGRIEAEEERTFVWLKRVLELSDQDLGQLMDEFNWFATVSRLRRGDLPRVSTPMILMPDEIAHLYVPARFYRQLTSSYRIHSGSLLATNRRVLFTQSDYPFEFSISKIVGIMATQDGRVQIELARRQGTGAYQVQNAPIVVETLRAVVAVSNRETVAHASGTRVIPADVKSAVFRRDGGRCVQCGAADYLEFDHIIPFRMGGATSLNNLQLLCRRCNLAKGAKL